MSLIIHFTQKCSIAARGAEDHLPCLTMAQTQTQTQTDADADIHRHACTHTHTHTCVCKGLPCVASMLYEKSTMLNCFLLPRRLSMTQAQLQTDRQMQGKAVPYMLSQLDCTQT